MAKVVFLTGLRLHDHVANRLTSKVAELLRRKGHEVILEQIPENLTSVWILNNMSPRRAIGKLIGLDFDQLDHIKCLKKKHGAQVFELFSSSPEQLGKAARADPADFKVAAIGPRDRLFQALSGGTSEKMEFVKVKGNTIPVFPGGEIQFIRSGEHTRIELPALRAALPREALDALDKLAAGVRAAKIERADLLLAESEFPMRYHVPLRARGQRKFLHPAIPEKIADAIHAKLTGK